MNSGFVCLRWHGIEAIQFFHSGSLDLRQGKYVFRCVACLEDARRRENTCLFVRVVV